MPLPEIWLAIAFLMIGLILIVAEAFQPGFFIAVPGGALFLGGALALAVPNIMFGGAAWLLWPVLFIAATGANIWLYKVWVPPGRKPLTMSNDSLPGEVGEVLTEVTESNIRGKVRIKGTTWSAKSAGGVVPVGSMARVVRAEGVHVVVEPVSSPSAGAAES